MKKLLCIAIVFLIIGMFSPVQGQTGIATEQFATKMDPLIKKLYNNMFKNIMRDSIEVGASFDAPNEKLILQFVSSNEEFSKEELVSLCFFAVWYFEREGGGRGNYYNNFTWSRVEFIKQYQDKEPIVEAIQLPQFVGFWSMVKHIPSDEIQTNEDVLAFVHKLFGKQAAEQGEGMVPDH